jgi:hypothetical protein
MQVFDAMARYYVIMGEIVRTKQWARWRGRSVDLERLVEEAAALIRAQMDGADPSLEVVVDLGGGDEEVYHSELDMQRSVGKFKPSRVQGFRLTAQAEPPVTLVVEFVLEKSNPAAKLQTRGAHRVIVEGIHGELGRVVEEGRQRLVPNPAALFAAGGLLGLAFSLLVTNLDWGWLPGGVAGQILGGVIYLVGFGLVFFGFNKGVPWILPWMEIVAPQQTTRVDQIKGKLGAGVGVALVAVIGALATGPFR